MPPVHLSFLTCGLFVWLLLLLVCLSELSNDQFGFRKGSSTTCALIKLLNDVYYIRSENDYVRIITLDLSKAFDSISHRAIIDGLHKSHYNPFLINWYNSFLSGRVHSTLVNDQLSRELTTSQGVPQGTVNGPPLFNSGTNDISVTTDNPERRCRLTVDFFLDFRLCLWISFTEYNLLWYNESIFLNGRSSYPSTLRYFLNRWLAMLVFHYYAHRNVLNNFLNGAV